VRLAARSRAVRQPTLNLPPRGRSTPPRPQHPHERRLVLLLERHDVEHAEPLAVADEDLGQLGQIPALKRQRPHVDCLLAKRSRSEGGEPLRFLSLRVDPRRTSYLRQALRSPNAQRLGTGTHHNVRRHLPARVASSTARPSRTGPPSLSERLARHSGAARRRPPGRCLRRTKRPRSPPPVTAPRTAARPPPRTGRGRGSVGRRRGGIWSPRWMICA